MFECALKREGFLRKGRRDAAQPNWDRFSTVIEGRFKEIDSPVFRAAITELKAHSPRQQVVCDEKLAWRKLQRRLDESEESFVLRLLRTARNNLFHGGKYPGTRIDEIAANREVLRAGLRVLKACFELHPGVAKHGVHAA